jgi:hypothetical protein
VEHKFLTTAAAAAARDRRKFFYCFAFEQKQFFKNFGVKPILSIYSIYDESKNRMR